MIPTVVSGLILMKKRKMMEAFPPFLKKLWKEWELRALAIVSLLVQIVLIVLGKRRRHISDRWIRAVVWSAYLLADYVATLALGVLSNDLGDMYNDGGKLERDNELTALWAPFFLLHLGGPDTITAYSLEDNELYLRHLLELLVQTIVTFYIVFLAWTGSRLSYLDIPMIVVGSIKYGERTWALWKASNHELQDSMLSTVDFGPNYAKLMDEYHLRQAEGYFITLEEVKQFDVEPPPPATADASHQGNIIKAYTMFQTFKRLFADLILSYEELGKSQSLFKNMTHEDAFDVIAIELGFVYDLLYTKATVIYTAWGIVSRIVTFSLTCIVLVIFSFDDMRKYKTVDIVVTFLLLGGAILLEIYAAFTLVFSDQTKRWLIKHRQTKLLQAISHIELVKLPRWSERMAQYNLLSLYLNEKPGPRLLEKHRYRSEETFEEDSRKLIFEHVQRKFNQLEKKEGHHAYLVDLCSQRGNSVLEECKQNILDNLKWRVLEWSVSCKFDQSILIWHIATELCCCTEEDEDVKTNLTMSKRISRYMLYLMAVQPTMLPVVIGRGLIILRDTRADFETFLEKQLSTSQKEKKSGRRIAFSDAGKELRKRACEMLLQENTHVTSIKYNRGKSVLFAGCRLALELNKITNRKDKWKVIRDVWLEMLTFAANKCRGRQHAHQLRRGGELLTHVWLLMAHFGMNEEFETHEREIVFTKR